MGDVTILRPGPDCDGEPVDPDVMSNYDHEINRERAEALKAQPGDIAPYPGWNFFGKVYFESDRYHCAVWVYGSQMATVSADSLEEIMETVCDEWGSK